MRSVLVALALLGLVGIGTFVWLARHSGSLLADFSVRIACPEGAPRPSVEEAEGFLRGHGFKVLDKVRAAEALGQPVRLPLDIIGLDSEGRAVDFLRLGLGSLTTSVVVRSRPPTIRAAGLEADIMNFIQADLGCTATQVERGKNGEEARRIYDEVMAIYRSWFDMAAKVPKTDR